MKQALQALLALVAILALATPAHAWLSRGGLACPFGSAYSDGCVGAPAGGSYIDRNFFNDVRQSGQTYVTRPPWNVPGVDYAIGYTGTLQDPATATLPTGCSYNATGVAGHTTWPTIFCNSFAGATNPTLSGLNLSSVGGHSCTTLMFNNALAGPVTYSNNYYKWDATCGGGPFASISASTASVTVTSNTVDMTDASPGEMAAVTIDVTGAQTYQYNVFINSQCRWVSNLAGGNTPGDTVIQFNAFIGMGYSCSDTGVHLESYETSGGHATGLGTMANFNTSFNVVSMAGSWNGLMAGVVSPFFQNNNGYGTNTVTNTIINNNVLIGNSANAGVSGLGYLVQLQHNYMTNVSIQNNYVDSTGTFGNYICANAPDSNAGGVTPFGSAPTIAGNIDLKTGAAANSMNYSGSCKAYGL